MGWLDLFGSAPDLPLLPDDAVHEVEKAMARAALVAWSTAALSRDGAERDALTQHADSLSRWSERLRMAQAGNLTGHEEWMAQDDGWHCAHDWMLRPESDTHVCEICGVER